MPAILKGPINLSIDEMIAIDTWLYVNDGEEPPSPQEIENAYRKFIPEKEWPYVVKEGRYRPRAGFIVTGQEPIDDLFVIPLCFACHTIPGIPETIGRVGPKLVMKTTAPQRIFDPDYKGKATNVREYVIESILDPSVYVVKGWPDNMPKDYKTKLSPEAIEKMVDYLLQIEESTEGPKKKLR